MLTRICRISGGVSCAPSAVVTFTAAPASYYVFTDWSGSHWHEEPNDCDDGCKQERHGILRCGGRAVVEEVRGTVAWDASAQKATIVRRGKTLELWIGKNVATLNGQSVNIDSNPKVVPIIMSGRTFLPLRFVAEALTLDVQWDAATQTITITSTP